MRFIVFPFAVATAEEALDWFEAQGATSVRLWRGPDGLVRGTGVVR